MFQSDINKIYIFGGCRVRNDNYFIEEYDVSELEDIDVTRKEPNYNLDVNKNNWAKSKVMDSTLFEPFESSRAHVVMIDDNIFFSPQVAIGEEDLEYQTNAYGDIEVPNTNSWINDNEKIFVIQYGSLLKPLPRIYSNSKILLLFKY